MDGEVRVQRAQGYSAVHSGKIMLTQAIKVKDTTRPGTKIFLNRCQFSNRCNHEQWHGLVTGRGPTDKLRTSTFDEKNIYYSGSFIFICSTALRAESMHYAVWEPPWPICPLHCSRRWDHWGLRRQRLGTRLGCHQAAPASALCTASLGCTSNASLCSPQRESRSHMPCASWQQAQSNGSIVSSRRAFRAWSTASHCSTLQGPRHMIALWVSPTWSLRRFLDLYSWTMKYKNSVLKKTGVTTSLLVVHAVNLKGWTLSGQLGYNHDHAIFNSDFRPGNNPRARLSSIKVIQSVAFEALTIL